MKLFFCVMFLISSTFSLFSHSADDILGYWYSPLQMKAPPVVVEIFRHNGMYYAYGFGWKDISYAPKNQKDRKNPNKDLRHRDLNGTVFMFDIKFNEASQQWEEGTSYQFANGKSYYFTNGKLSPDKDTLRWRAGKDKLVIFGWTLEAWIRIPKENLQIHLNKHDKPSMEAVIKTISQK